MSETDFKVIRPPTMVLWKDEAALDRCLRSCGMPKHMLTPEQSSYWAARLLEEMWRLPKRLLW